jgi:hypothetical protein
MDRRFCLLLLSAALPLFCQTERGNITGQVKDASGVGIPGAELIATHVLTGVQTKTQLPRPPCASMRCSSQANIARQVQVALKLYW